MRHDDPRRLLREVSPSRRSSSLLARLTSRFPVPLDCPADPCHPERNPCRRGPVFVTDTLRTLGDGGKRSAVIVSRDTAAILMNSSVEKFGCIPLEIRRNQRERESGIVLPLTGMRTSRGKGTRMRHLLLRVTLAAAVATIISPVRAQMPSPAAAPTQSPSVAYSGGTYNSYPLLAPTPRDAYRDGTINRWQLEQLEGPLPQAMQGPSPDGNRGGDGGGSSGGRGG